MKIGDVIIAKGKPQASYELREQKTGKTKKFPFGKNVQKAIEAFLSGFQGNRDDFLLISRKGENRPITHQHAWRIMNQAARTVDIQDKIGMHTLRKTFWYHAYRAGTDITLLQQIFNHSAPSITLRYIEIQQDDIDQVIINLNL